MTGSGQGTRRLMYSRTSAAAAARVRAAPPQRWWADAAIGVATLSVVIVMGMWITDGGLTSLSSPGGLATGLGRVTGLVAADLLLLQVLLMARIPWVERSFGQDQLARWHRLVGFTSFWLMVAHVLLITLGYAQAGRAGLLHEAWTLTTSYPGMLLAVAGTGLLTAVVALSIRAARQRLRYESWHLLHLYAYLGVGLALPHEIWTGADFATSPTAQAYWWTAYAGTMAAVLVFRVAIPVWRSSYHHLVVQKVVSEADGVVSVYLRGRHLDRLPVRAGQFFLWRFLDGPGWSRAHPYSLSAAPRSDRLRITVKNLGDGSARLARLRPGTRAFIEGPFGAVTTALRRRRKILLVAAGVGITMMRALIEDLNVRPGDLTLIYRVSRAQDAVFASELESFAAGRGDRVVFLEGPRGPEGSWLPDHLSTMTEQAALRWLVPDVAEHDAFLCGPPSWMTSVEASLRSAGVPDTHIHREEFAW
jgi:predicted ferric reductase